MHTSHAHPSSLSPFVIYKIPNPLISLSPTQSSLLFSLPFMASKQHPMSTKKKSSSSSSSISTADFASWYCAIVLLALILLTALRETSLSSSSSSSSRRYGNSINNGDDEAVMMVKGNQLLEKGCDEIYVVGEGETLHSISVKCGDPFIVEQNPHIHDPDDIFPGLVIKITATIPPPSIPIS